MPFEYPFMLSVSDNTQTTDVSELAKSIVWTGSYKQVARTLDFDILFAPNDANTPKVNMSGGMAAALRTRDGDLFAGTILDISRDSLADVVSLTAYDWGIYLKRNEEYRKVENATPEDIAAEICGKVGLSVGSIVKTGVKLSRNFFPASYYDEIRTLYALAAEQTSAKYMIRILGKTLSVLDVTKPEKMLLLKPGSNLISFRIKETGSDLINSVGIYDENDKLIDKVSDSDTAAIYGVMQAAIQKRKNEDPMAAAQKLIDDGKVKTTITAQCVGNPLLIAGNSVVVEEPITGTFGQFYILTDSHSWNSGIYRTQITMQLEAVVDEATAGKAIKEGQ